MSGFVMVPEWFRRKKPSGNAVLVYVTLASYGSFRTASGTYEDCRPTRATMAEDTELSESSVKRAVDELLAMKAIERRERRGDNGVSLPSVYRVHFGDLTELEGSTSEPPPQGEGATHEPPEGSTHEPLRGSPVTRNQEPSTHNQHQEELPPQQAAPDAGMILADWIDYCQSGGLTLPKRTIGRYAAEIKRLLDEGFGANHIKNALAEMRRRSQVHKPGMLPDFMVQVQRPVSAPPARQEYKTAAEKKQASNDRASLRAKIIDRIRAEEPGRYDLSKYQDSIDLGARVDGILAQLDSQSAVATCHTGVYTGPDRGIIDAEWTQDPTPREVTAG